jgi:hypothetical protein
VGAPQLVAHGQVDYLVFDYLAELTMSILAAARSKNPELGYATDFVTVTIKAILKDVVAQNIRVISNAGGVNPQACARAIRALAAEQGVTVKVAVVLGDDVMPLLPHCAAKTCASCKAAPIARKGAHGQRLPGRAAGEARTGRRRADRHHRPLRGQRRDAGRADA